MPSDKPLHKVKVEMNLSDGNRARFGVQCETWASVCKLIGYKADKYQPVSISITVRG